MNTKKVVLFTGIVGSILFFLPIIIIQISSCYQKNWFFCRDSYEIIAASLLIFFPILLLSLITYKMREEVFRAWWRFARWWAPVTVVVTLLLENAGGGGGLGISGAVSSAFDILVLGVLYAILVIVSFILIAWKYFATRHPKQS